MPVAPHLVSIQVGLPQKMGEPQAADPLDRPWESAIFKQAVTEPIWLGLLNLAGDGQVHQLHGGRDRAILAYAASHYEAWRREYGDPDLPYGAFGENFTIAGQTEDDVCLGDIYAVGAARIEVSEARAPCLLLERRQRRPGLLQRVKDTGRIGWLFRVLREGLVTPDRPVILEARPYPDWPASRLYRLMQALRSGASDYDHEAGAELARCPALSTVWRERFMAGPQV